MIHTSAVASPEEALAIIRDFETQTGRVLDPMGLQDVFERTVCKDVDVTTPAGTVKQKRFAIKEGQPSGLSNVREVHQLMHQALGALGDRPLSASDVLLVNQFKQQLHFSEQMLKAKSAQVAPQPTESTEGHGTPGAQLPFQRTVQEVKNELREKKIPLTKLHSDVFAGFAIGGVEGTFFAGAVAVAVLAVAAGFLSLGIAFAVVAGLAGVIALTALALSIGAVMHNTALKSKLDKSVTPESIVPLYRELTPQAQIHFLVNSGPDFRKALLAWDKQHNGGSQDLEFLCKFIDNMTSPTVPPDIKEEYYRAMMPMNNLLFEHRKALQELLPRVCPFLSQDRLLPAI